MKSALNADYRELRIRIYKRSSCEMFSQSLVVFSKKQIPLGLLWVLISICIFPPWLKNTFNKCWSRWYTAALKHWLQVFKSRVSFEILQWFSRPSSLWIKSWQGFKEESSFSITVATVKDQHESYLVTVTVTVTAFVTVDLYTCKIVLTNADWTRFSLTPICIDIV